MSHLTDKHDFLIKENTVVGDEPYLYIIRLAIKIEIALYVYIINKKWLIN